MERWKLSGGSEMANFQSFVNELTDLLAVERPYPATSGGENNDYRFKRPVTFNHTGRESCVRIDLNKRCSFILEAKQCGKKVKINDLDQLALILQVEALKFSHSHGVGGMAKWDDTI